MISNVSYNTTISYQKGIPINFPDFTLTYQGHLKVKIPVPTGVPAGSPPASATVSNFLITYQKGQDVLSIPAGQLNPKPIIFTVNESRFILSINYTKDEEGLEINTLHVTKDS